MVTDKKELEFSHFVNTEADLQGGVTSLTPLGGLTGPTLATSSPYKAPTTPRDVMQLLPPNGSPFSLFGDPYAQQMFIPTNINVIRKSNYWYMGRNEDNDYTESEVALLLFLGKHRVATRSQIARAIFPNNHSNDTKVRDFLRRCANNHGILVPFSWISPCQDERTRPHIYGLSPVAAQAARDLNHQLYLPKQFQFIPVNYPPGGSPSMGMYFNTLIANEFYCKLFELDRVIDWQVGERIPIKNGRDFRVQYSISLIKDMNDFRMLWVEVVRPQANWFDHFIRRLQDIQVAFTSLTRENRPEAVVIIVDNESRLSDISKLAEQFSPDVPIRFSTDELVISNDSPALFYSYSDVDGLNPSNVRFLQKEWQGMTASEYFATYNYSLDMLEDADY